MITVYGAGAIGGITGAALARAGHDVLLVDRFGEHVDAINRDGITVVSKGVDTTTKVRPDTPDRLGRDPSPVLRPAKTHPTANALAARRPRLPAPATSPPPTHAPT